MAELLSYGKGWNPMLGDVLEPVSARTAKRRHDKGDWYAAVFEVTVLEGKCGRAVVGVNGDEGYVRVEFWMIDAEQHHLVHHLDTVGGQLFVAQISRYGRDPDYHDSFRWEPGEPAVWTRYSTVPPSGELATRSAWDPEPHRFAFPAFGEYEHLLDDSLLDRLWPGHDQLPVGVPGRS